LLDVYSGPTLAAMFNPSEVIFMQIEIQVHGFDLTHGLRSHTPDFDQTLI